MTFASVRTKDVFTNGDTQLSTADRLINSDNLSSSRKEVTLSVKLMHPDPKIFNKTLEEIPEDATFNEDNILNYSNPMMNRTYDISEILQDEPRDNNQVIDMNIEANNDMNRHNNQAAGGLFAISNQNHVLPERPPFNERSNPNEILGTFTENFTSSSLEVNGRLLA